MHLEFFVAVVFFFFIETYQMHCTAIFNLIRNCRGYYFISIDKDLPTC